MIHEAVPKLHRCCKQPPEPHKQQHKITNHTITIYSITITIHTTTITTDQNHYEWWNDPLARLCLSCTGVPISLRSLANNKQHKADRHRLTIEIKEKLSWLLKHMLNVCYFLLNMHIFALQCWLLRAMSGKGWNGTVDSVTYTGVSLPSCFRHGFLASSGSLPVSPPEWVSVTLVGNMLVLHLLLLPILGMAESAKEEDPRIVHGQVLLSPKYCCNVSVLKRWPCDLLWEMQTVLTRQTTTAPCDLLKIKVTTCPHALWSK